MFTDALAEFRADWLLAGKATSTVDFYLSLLRLLDAEALSFALADVRVWVGDASTVSMRRKRAQAVRAFGRWSESIGDNDFPWWRNLPVPTETEKPQPTATPADFDAGLSVLESKRDRAVLSVLWGCGLRRSEVANLVVSDVNVGDGVLVIRSSKTGKPRVVPMPPITVRSVRRHLRGWNESDLFALTTNGIRLMLRRNNLLSAHAWRRGWAVQSLRIGVSETSVRSAAGWSSGAMVARYTRAMSAELALDEFQRSWNRANS
jgi:integrase